MKTKAFTKLSIHALMFIALLSCSAMSASAQTVAPSWSNTGSLNVPRAGHIATALPNGKVLVAGGYNGEPLASAELYDPATGTWSVTGSLSVPRAGLSATLLPNGKVLVVGGWNKVSFLSASGTAELYDPATGRWSLTSNPQFTHWGLDFTTLLADGRVLVAGGFYYVNSATGQFGPSDKAEIYDPATDTWSITGDLHEARFFHTLTLLQNGKVLAAGGDDLDGYFGNGLGGTVLTSELYDPNTGTWTVTGSLNQGHENPTATLLQNGFVLVAGGRFYEEIGGSAELYNPTTGERNYTGSLNVPRQYDTATLLPNGQVLVAGGDTINWSTINSAEIYAPTTGSWSATASLNTARVGHTATLLSNGRVLVVGGSDGGYPQTTFFRSAELYDPGSQNTNPIDDPQPFVRQQYLDFLNREPDVSGLAHWTNEITMCSDVANRVTGETEAQCIDRKRVNTSGAFYLSNEFQNSANFLIRVNWGSLGMDRAIGRQCIVGQYSALDAVCRPLYFDYLSDLAKLTQGIVVNDALDPNAINLNKHNFVNEFVTRADFLAAYPNAMTAAEYVDKLTQTTGVALTNQERIDLITKVGTDGRAAVLYDIVDGSTTIDGGFLRFDTRYGKAFYDQEFNPAFVFVEYLGYLRRNPDQAGFDHWLGKLTFYGNFVDAEMVRSFIVSDEYRGRFNPQ